MKVPRYSRDDEGNTEYLGAIVLQDGKAHSRAKRTFGHYERRRCSHPSKIKVRNVMDRS